MKLYAGGIDIDYEYAVWAENKTDMAKRLGLLEAYQAKKDIGFYEQKGKQLKSIIVNKDRIYRRKLDDVSEWEVWRKVVK